ncbi:MAG: sulfite exporter TauE/SafE family protein [Candidatus Omnitrophota bacterium]
MPSASAATTPPSHLKNTLLKRIKSVELIPFAIYNKSQKEGFMNPIFYILLGILAGVASGLFGIGGGIVMVPALVLLFGLTQHQAQGTALCAMIPCVTVFAALRYYQGGNVKLLMAVFIAAGILLGGYIGATFANNISSIVLRRTFGVLLLFVSLRLIFFK